MDATFPNFMQLNTAQFAYRFERCRFLNGVLINNSDGEPFSMDCEAHDLWNEL